MTMTIASPLSEVSRDMLDRVSQPVLESHKAPLHIGAVTLKAHDLGALTRFYESHIGLDVIEAHRDSVTLGSGGVGFLHLLAAPDAKRPSPKAAGLFHTAFLLPSRAALGAWFTGAQERGVLITGASDHDVSEAFYLDDPEGNGIEVYADRPRSAWRFLPDGVHMTTSRMDVQAVASAGAAIESDGRFPSEARIGHVHLKVGDIAAAECFYRDLIGLDIMAKRPGGTFFSSGGYHHHIATNIWQSAGAPPRDENTLGLAAVEIAVSDASIMDAIELRLDVSPLDAPNRSFSVLDPWSTELRFTLEA